MNHELKVSALTCEYRPNPLGIGVTEPRISWQLQSDQRGTIQRGYQIVVAGPDADFDQPLWDSGYIESDRSVLVPYGGPALQSRTRYYYKVKVWDTAGRESAWSDVAWWETGLLATDEWKAEWITAHAEAFSPDSEACFLLRKHFELERSVRSARVYATAAGMYELHVNGQRVSDEWLAPGWTSYHNRLQYQTYDITALLREGGNAIGIVLADGWYRSGMGARTRCFKYGDRRAALLQMHVTFADGSETVITTDSSWKAYTGPILSSSIYNGETYDARLEQDGWSESGFADEQWKKVEILDLPKHQLVAQENVPVRVTETLKPISFFVTPAGDRVLDMGQNMVGRIRMRVTAPEGTKIVLRHAEVLDRDGNIYFGNLRSARQTATYIARGNGVEEYAPHFTFMGFRYVKVEGYPGDDLPIEAFTGEVMHSDMAPTGQFECSDERVNQLQSNILWGQRGNFVDVPTDCPQRDERLGWTGDAQVFIGTALYNFNGGPFFTKWLRDLKAEQYPDGGVPFVIPDIRGDANSAAWSDAATICPWALYRYYGDERLLAEQYDSMKKWVEYIRAQGDDEYLWNTGFHYGDWLGLDAKEGSYVGATPRELIATAFYAHSARIVRDAAKVLGYEEDAKRYEQLHRNVVQAFREEFITPAGRIAAPTQTAHVLALMFDLVDDETRPRVAQDLNDLIVDSNFHLTTGFVGTPYICFALSDNGYHDTALKLLLQDSYPGWLYSVSKGATTIWEHWDSIKPDGSFWSDDMNSFNHYAYGAIGEWLYKRLAGLDLDDATPGFKRIRIEPLLADPYMTYARTAHDSMYGRIEAGWDMIEDQVSVHAVIPPNTTADVVLRNVRRSEIQLQIGEEQAASSLSDDYSLPAGILSVQENDHGVTISVGSGSYRFIYRNPNTRQTITYTENTRLVDIVINPAAKEILKRHIPELFFGPYLDLSKKMSLAQLKKSLLAGMATEKMEKILLELNQLKLR